MTNYFLELLTHFIYFAFFLRIRSLADNEAAAWRSWGGNCTQFGLTPTVKGLTEIRTVTSPPISPNRLLSAGIFPFFHFFFVFNGMKNDN